MAKKKKKKTLQEIIAELPAEERARYNEYIGPEPSSPEFDPYIHGTYAPPIVNPKI